MYRDGKGGAAVHGRKYRRRPDSLHQALPGMISSSAGMGHAMA